MRGFYRFLVLDGHVPSSPAEDLQAPRSWPALPRFLSIEEVDELLGQPDVGTPAGVRDRALLELLYATGMRVTELVTLKTGDVSLDLDVTIQAQILDLLQKQQRERNMAVILITHNLGIVSGYTDDVAVMYAGQIVENCSTEELIAHPRMPYTEALMNSAPLLSDPPHTRLNAIPGLPPNLLNVLQD